MTWRAGLGALAIAAAVGGGCGDDPAASDPPAPTVTAQLRGTATGADDLVRLGRSTSLAIDAQPAGLTVSLRSVGAGAVTLTPSELTGGPSPVTIVVTGVAASQAEADTAIEALVDGEVVATLPVTVVEGVAVAFEGTFAFAVENNNGAVATGQSCGGVDDPAVWRATPLPCEGLSSLFNQVFVTEGDRPERWSSESGKRPGIAVTVTAVRSFGPTLDLTGRDPAVTVGTVIGAASDAAAIMITDDCDDDPTTGEPDGRDQGLEPLLDLGLTVGASLRIDGSASPARLWTAFPTPPTAEETADDLATVDDLLFPAAAMGCSDPLTFFDAMGQLQCEQPHSLAGHLRRHAGFRSMVRRAWANYTNRSVTVEALDGSLVGELLGGEGELFLQLADYDWYTLMGRVDKGMIGSPGAIPARFEAWPVTTCPEPREPDAERGDDPFSALGT